MDSTTDSALVQLYSILDVKNRYPTSFPMVRASCGSGGMRRTRQAFAIQAFIECSLLRDLPTSGLTNQKVAGRHIVPRFKHANLSTTPGARNFNGWYSVIGCVCAKALPSRLKYHRERSYQSKGVSDAPTRTVTQKREETHAHWNIKHGYGPSYPILAPHDHDMSLC